MVRRRDLLDHSPQPPGAGAFGGFALAIGVRSQVSGVRSQATASVLGSQFVKHAHAG
jgi:hypothetical protein